VSPSTARKTATPQHNGFARAAETDDDFHVMLHARLDKVLKLIDPQKTVVFALDGPAPLAKLLTQRCCPLSRHSGNIPLSTHQRT
jgi:5'-3' exonuclease